MYKWLLFFVFIVSIGGMSGCVTDETGSAVAETGSETMTYEVLGMDCPGCHGGLEKNLEKVSGVEYAQANWKTQRVVVGVEPGAQVAEAEIVKAVENSNLTIGERLE